MRLARGFEGLATDQGVLWCFQMSQQTTRCAEKNGLGWFLPRILLSTSPKCLPFLEVFTAVVWDSQLRKTNHLLHFHSDWSSGAW